MCSNASLAKCARRGVHLTRVFDASVTPESATPASPQTSADATRRTSASDASDDGYLRLSCAFVNPLAAATRAGVTERAKKQPLESRSAPRSSQRFCSKRAAIAVFEVPKTTPRFCCFFSARAAAETGTTRESTLVVCNRHAAYCAVARIEASSVASPETEQETGARVKSPPNKRRAAAARQNADADSFSFVFVPSSFSFLSTHHPPVGSSASFSATE
mmetsp:Transcript_9542/g.35529  ORF Transcript_9542/g.35529 Transcript_9542/m.35529 type:complete len:218 (-) Transcript_9542:626-1279(-)